MDDLNPFKILIILWTSPLTLMFLTARFGLFAEASDDTGCINGINSNGILMCCIGGGTRPLIIVQGPCWNDI